MNEEQIQEQLRRTAEGIAKAAPAALKAIDGALARLNAPWYVRAWHQWKGHQGWGAGEELHIFFDAILIVICLGIVWLIS